MPIRMVFLDVGETLIDERRYWRSLAEANHLPDHVLWAALGASIARGERGTLRRLGVERPRRPDVPQFERGDLYPDALPCLLALRNAGYRVGIAGNQPDDFDRFAHAEGLPADVIGSSASWGCEKPSAGFFVRLIAEAGVAPHEIAYVGDRIDNDVVPAVEMGIVAIHIRRGPWGYLQPGTERASARIESLVELPGVLSSLP
jgi:FMN phosphatase YigB (HAD superfamily)